MMLEQVDTQVDTVNAMKMGLAAMQAMGPLDLADDDELMAELDELEAEELDAQLLDLGPVASGPVAGADELEAECVSDPHCHTRTCTAELS